MGDTVEKQAPQETPRGEPPRGFPEDYHEYVFRDGKLIGDFDNMYRYAKGIPWNQDERCLHWNSEVGILMLRQRAPYPTILEIGCGLGYMTARLKELLSEGQGRILEGFDVSPEAIRKARGLHSGVEFYVDDIRQDHFQPWREYDLVVVRDLFWYVFPHMEAVVRNIQACLKPQGTLYLYQSFPALDQPFVGRETFPSPEALTSYFSTIDPIHSAVLFNHHWSGDGPILHWMGLRVR